MKKEIQWLSEQALAQHDYFGAYMCKRIGIARDEFFYTNWNGRDGETASSTYVAKED